MKKCLFEEKIDSYLLNRLPEAERNGFEDHYFNCPSCFAGTAELEEILHVIREDPSLVAVNTETAREHGTTARTRPWPAPLKSREWVLAALVACVVMVVLALLLLRPPGTPVFLLDDDETVRGYNLTLISPVIDIEGAPSYFEWQHIGDDITYDVTLYNLEPLWKTTTRETRITLPEDVRAEMVAGRSYSLQVKGYSADGTLIAVSSRIRITMRLQN